MPLALALVLWLAPVATTPGLDEAAAYSRRHGGQALLVIVGERVVLEQWQHRKREAFAQTIMSGTKAFSCALATLAVADGKLTLDELAAARVPELARPLRSTGAPGRAAAITVRHLLTQTSGLAGGGTPLGGDHRAWIRAHARNLVGAEPGTRFTYGAAHWDLLEVVLQDALGADPIDVLDTRVLAPLGVEQRDWKRDGVGQRFLAFGLVTTPRSWARYGMLLRDDGVYAGRRVLPPGAAAACLGGSDVNPAYGQGFWLNRPMPAAAKKSNGFPRTLAGLVADGQRRAILPDGPDDLAMAAGSNDTRLYVVPSRGLVVVRFGYQDDPTWSDAAFLAPLLPASSARAAPPGAPEP